MSPRLRLLLVACCLVVAGCGGSDRRAVAIGEPDAGATTGTSADTTATLSPIDAAGILARVGDGRARVTVVNMWATWCVPCRQEFPEMLAAAAAHRDDGVRLMLVSTDFEEQSDDVRRFLEQHAVRDTAYVKHDGDQAFIDTMYPEWTGTIPATFVYDASGRRVAFWEGRADRARFEAAIKKAMSSPAPTNKEKNT